MKAFKCQSCGGSLFFENAVCLNCQNNVGFDPELDRMIAVLPEGPYWREAPVMGQEDVALPQLWRFCQNWELSACNWLVPHVDEGEELPLDPTAEPAPVFCSACQHNRMIPDLSDPTQHARWGRIEAAKRRLIYGLDQLGLPRPSPLSGAAMPLTFDFLAEEAADGRPVVTGHANGLITIALSEADDVLREKARAELSEAYRTLLGHFRHEVGHYYWELLVRDGPALEPFRALFGDERADYGLAMEAYYRDGPPPGNPDDYVSTYARMHPWEDWAETWAHYLHICDALQTAAATGISLISPQGQPLPLSLTPWREADGEGLFQAWLVLASALNSLNRSLGQGDSYPFVISSVVQAKLGFVHDLVQGRFDATLAPPPEQGESLSDSSVTAS